MIEDIKYVEVPEICSNNAKEKSVNDKGDLDRWKRKSRRDKKKYKKVVA